MKDRKTKEKKHESTIGKIIYGFLLFMPLFAIGVTCLVNTFNQKANDTTETTIVEVPSYYNTNDINSVNDLISGNAYLFSIERNLVDTFFILRFSTYTELANDNKILMVTSPTFYGDAPYIRKGGGENANLYFTIDVDTTYLVNSISIAFIYDESLSQQNISSIISYITRYDTYFKENVEQEVITYIQNDIFYYAVDKVQQSPLFNWAENSIIYTGMNSFTNSLSITTPFIPLLLTYWLIISVVYFIYDIVLIILVILHRKIHYLEESI